MSDRQHRILLWLAGFILMIGLPGWWGLIGVFFMMAAVS